MRDVQSICTTGRVDWLTRVGLFAERRSFVGAEAPRGGHRDVQQAQIDAELAAVLIPMVEHDVAQEWNARHSPNFPVALR